MSTSKEPDSGAPVKPEDWEKTMADVKRLVEALHTLIPSTSPANPKPEPEPEPKQVSRSEHEISTSYYAYGI
jgi:hypothetical protein